MPLISQWSTKIIEYTEMKVVIVLQNIEENKNLILQDKLVAHLLIQQIIINYLLHQEI